MEAKPEVDEKKRKQQKGAIKVKREDLRVQGNQKVSMITTVSISLESWLLKHGG